MVEATEPEGKVRLVEHVPEERVHDVGEKRPVAPSNVQLMVPVGVVLEPDDTSLTVAPQVTVVLTGVEDVEQVTTTELWR